MKFVATINVPGYSPESEPAEFDTACEAWAYLAEERARAEDESEDGGETYSEIYDALGALGTEAHWRTGIPTDIYGLSAAGTGTYYGPTPGYDGNHDQGLAYSVSVTERALNDPIVDCCKRDAADCDCPTDDNVIISDEGDPLLTS